MIMVRNLSPIKFSNTLNKRRYIRSFANQQHQSKMHLLNLSHSIQEKVICQRYEFDSIQELTDTLNRFVDFYNFRRIHSGTKYQAPAKFILQQGIDMNQFDLSRALDCAFLQANTLVENVSSF